MDKQEEWEKEFDDKFVDKYELSDKLDEISKTELKEFIHNLRSKDRDTLVEKFKIKFNGYGGNLGFTLSDVKQIILEVYK